MTNYTHDMVRITQQLAEARAQQAVLEDRVEELITEARNESMGWRLIGFALGTSGQAAWERYGLTPEEKSARSRQNRPSIEQDTLAGLEMSREDRVAVRKIVLEKKRAKKAQED